MNGRIIFLRLPPKQGNRPKKPIQFANRASWRTLSPFRRNLAAITGLWVLTLVAYGNSFTAGFTLDNKGLIVDDARVHELTAENLGNIVRHTYWWPVGESGLYRPFTTLTYLFNYAVLGNGTNPVGYHVINFLLHACNVALVLLLARRCWREFWPPVFVAAIWAVHPVLTESVTNIVGRADLLAGTAVLGGRLLFLEDRPVGLALLTLVGVFSKESAVAVLGVIVLYEMAGVRHAKARLSAVAVPIVAMLAVRYAVLAWSPPTQFPFTDNPIVAADFFTGRLTALGVIARYVGLLVWPARLSCDYSYAQIPLATGAGVDYLRAMPAVAIAVVVLVLFRKNRTAFFVGASAVLVFLPTSNLFFAFGAIMAERFLYLPAIAFAALVVWTAYRMPKFAPLVLGVILAAFAARTYARNADWQDELSLSASAVEAAPRSFKAHVMRANALLAADPAHANIDEVIAESDRALSILDPLPDRLNTFDPYQRAAEYYFMRGDLLRRSSAGESAAAYQRALALIDRAQRIAAGPKAAWEQERAKLYLRLNQTQAALDAALKARALDPSDVESHRVLAGILVDANREDEAVRALATGVLLTNDAGLRRTLSGVNGPVCAGAPDAIRLRLGSGRRDLAIEQKRTAIRDYGCPAAPLDAIVP